MVVVQLGDNMGEKYDGYSAALEKLASRYSGSSVVLASTILNGYRSLSGVNEEIRKAARERGCLFIDLRYIMMDEGNVGFRYHPNDRGMMLIANAMYKNILQD